MKKQTFLSVIIAVLMALTGFTRSYAGSCTIPCTGPWMQSSVAFTQTINGCLYKFYVNYEYRPCMGAMQVRLIPGCTCLGFVVEQVNPACGTLHCGDVPTLYRIVYNKLITTLGMPILHVSPSPCYYLGTIIVPPAAEACFGMTPGSKRYVTVPCDTNGCCYSKLEAVPNNGIQQTVIQSTGCVQSGIIPASWNISWSCDILGGGSMTFTVPFIPDSPLVCQTLCANGTFFFGGVIPPKNGSLGIGTQIEKGSISGFNIYPNPVTDNCAVSFSSAKAGEDVVLELTDISGKTISTFNLMTKAGTQSITLDTHTLPSGLYTVRLVYGEQVFVGKITK